MVTGVEVAGLVLASFPLFVGGLEHYIKGLQTIQYWRRYRREFENYARALRCQTERFLNTLELLFEGIVETDEELASLVNDPHGASWRREKFKKSLMMRLDHNYEVFLETLQTMHGSLEETKAKLNLGESGKVVWEDRSSVQREMERLDFVLFKGPYSEMLRTIERGNQTLFDLTYVNKELEPVRRKRRSKAPQEHFKLIQRYARSLFDAVIMGKAWTCHCKQHHTASLRLERRPIRHGTYDETTARQAIFRILLSKTQAMERAQPTCEWRHLEVETKGLASETREDLLSENSTLSSIHVSQLSIVPGQRRKLQKKTRFEIPNRLTPVVQPSSALASRSSRTPGSNRTACKQITNICATVYQAHGSQQVLGFLAENKTAEHRHHLIICNDANVNRKIRTTSLESLLKHGLIHRNKPAFLWRDRLEIAVTLASNVLQLHKTSWLRNCWSSSDIFFHHEEENSLNTQGPRYREPYLYWKMSSVDATLSGNSVSNVLLQKHLIHSEALFALGSTLIELSFGETLSELQSPEDSDSSADITRFNTARRLLNNVYDQSGGNFGDAVRRCLDCPFDIRDKSFDNDEFQTAVFESIVTPLAIDLEAFNAAIQAHTAERSTKWGGRFDYS